MEFEKDISLQSTDGKYNPYFSIPAKLRVVLTFTLAYFIQK